MISILPFIGINIIYIYKTNPEIFAIMRFLAKIGFESKEINKKANPKS
jgi:hypothetical protein